MREAGLPFREAHHATGRAVKLAEGRGVGLADLPLADLQAIDAAITDSVYAVLTPERSAAVAPATAEPRPARCVSR